MIDLLRLCRLYYTVPMSFILMLTIWYAAGEATPGQRGAAFRATAALAMIIAGGYAINDACDRRVDRINAPHRPIPAGRVHPATAAIWGSTLVLGGLGIASTARWQYLAALACVTVVMVFYDVTSKRLGFGKQLIVAFLMTSFYPLAFAQAGDTTSSRVPTLYIFPAWLFLTSFAYEILKDIRDIRGDRVARGMPTWIERRPSLALGIARGAMVASAVALAGPAFVGCGWIYAAIIPVAMFLAIRAASLPRERAMMAIYAECVVVGIAATADIMVLGSQNLPAT